MEPGCGFCSEAIRSCNTFVNDNAKKFDDRRGNHHGILFRWHDQRLLHSKRRWLIHDDHR